MSKEEITHRILQLRKTLLSYKDDEEMETSKEYIEYTNMIAKLKEEHQMTLADIVL